MKLFCEILFVTSLLVASVIARPKLGAKDIKHEKQDKSGKIPTIEDPDHPYPMPPRFRDVLKDVEHGIKKRSNSDDDQFEYMLNSLNQLMEIDDQYQQADTRKDGDMLQFLRDDFEDQDQDQDQKEEQGRYQNHYQHQRQRQQVGNQQRGFDWRSPKPSEDEVDDNVDGQDELHQQQQRQQQQELEENKQQRGLDWTEWQYAKPGTPAGYNKVSEESGDDEEREEKEPFGQDQMEWPHAQPNKVEDTAEEIEQDQFLGRAPTHYLYNREKKFEDKNDGHENTQRYPYQYFGQNEFGQYGRGLDQQDVQPTRDYYHDQSRHPSQDQDLKYYRKLRSAKRQRDTPLKRSSESLTERRSRMEK